MKPNNIFIIIIILTSSHFMVGCSTTSVQPSSVDSQDNTRNNATASYYLTKYGYVDVPVGKDGKIEMTIYSHPYISASDVISNPTYVKVYQTALWIGQSSQNGLLEHLVYPPQQTYSSTRIYHEVGQNVPVNATENTILDTLSFGYDNIQGVRLYVQFRFYYNLAKYPPVPYGPKNVHGSISFKPYNVTWWTEEQQQRINPNITKIDFINPFLSMP